jgi:hypothetical protein
MDKRRGYDRDSVPSGQLVKQGSHHRQEGERVSDAGTTRSRHSFNKLPSRNEQFGSETESFVPPPLPYEPGSQSGPPTRGELRETIDIG